VHRTAPVGEVAVGEAAGEYEGKRWGRYIRQGQRHGRTGGLLGGEGVAREERGRAALAAGCWSSGG
jgi:hypothetical protein